MSPVPKHFIHVRHLLYNVDSLPSFSNRPNMLWAFFCIVGEGKARLDWLLSFVLVRPVCCNWFLKPKLQKTKLVFNQLQLKHEFTGNAIFIFLFFYHMVSCTIGFEGFLYLFFYHCCFIISSFWEYHMKPPYKAKHFLHQFIDLSFFCLYIDFEVCF